MQTTAAEVLECTLSPSSHQGVECPHPDCGDGGGDACHDTSAGTNHCLDGQRKSCIEDFCRTKILLANPLSLCPSHCAPRVFPQIPEQEEVHRRPCVSPTPDPLVQVLELDLQVRELALLALVLGQAQEVQVPGPGPGPGVEVEVVEGEEAEISVAAVVAEVEEVEEAVEGVGVGVGAVAVVVAAVAQEPSFLLRGKTADSSLCSKSFLCCLHPCSDPFLVCKRRS